MPEVIVFKSIGFGQESILWKAEWDEAEHPRGADGRFGDAEEEWQTFGIDPHATGRQFQEDHVSTGAAGRYDFDASDPKGLNEDEADAIRTYSTSQFAGINKGLRDGQPARPVDGDSSTTADQIQSAINKGTIDRDTVVFRGTHSTNLVGRLRSLSPGDTLTDPGFVSTSLVKDSAKEGFADSGSFSDTALIRIAVPEGSHCTAVYGMESEILLGSNSTYRLDKVEQDRDGQPIYHMTYVGADPYHTGTMAKGARSRSETPSDNRFHWNDGDVIITRKADAKKAEWDEAEHPRGEGGRFESEGFGQEQIIWKAPAKAVTPRMKWADHADHAIHAAIVAHYAPKLARAMAASLTGIDAAIAAAKRKIKVVTKAVDPQDAAAAREAVAQNVKINSSEVAAVLRQMVADAAVATSHGAALSIGSGAIMIQGLDTATADFDWASWEPGWAEAADLARVGGLQRLLDAVDVTIKYMDENTISKIGDLLAQGLANGDPATVVAQSMLSTVTQFTPSGDQADPNLLDPSSRAFLIANTEASRAMAEASIDTYAANDIAKWEWLSEDDDRTCDECIGKNGEQFDVGGDDQQPPQHPRCRCVVLPVLLTPDLDTGPSPISDEEQQEMDDFLGTASPTE